MVGQNLCRCGSGFIRLDASVCPHLEGELVVVRHLAYARVLDGVIHLADGGEDGVDRQHADGHVGGLVAVSRNITAALAQGDLHVQVRILVQGGENQVGIDDLDLFVANDIARGHNALAGGGDVDDLGAVAIQLGGQGLEVQDDLGDILFNPGDRGKLMQYTIDADGRDRYAGQRGKQNSAQ